MCYGEEVIHVPHVSLRVTSQEKNWMESYAQVQGIKLSDAIKEAFFEKLEDEYDLRVIKEHEKEKTKGDMKYYTAAEIAEKYL